MVPSQHGGTSFIMSVSGPIGIFDSGFGGLTVYKSIRENLPEYNYLYLGDNARTPYGTRSFETVYEYTLEAVKYLFDQGCHLIILACNTASAKALRNIQQLDLPKIAPDRRVLGVIRPTTELAGEISKTKSVGVMATNGTVKSESYVMEINKFHPGLEIWQQACPMWVPLVENGEWDNNGTHYFVKKCVDSLLKKSQNIDTIILACTHYPMLEGVIQGNLPAGINLLSQGPIVANRLADYLERHPEIEQNCAKNGIERFQTTDSAEQFDQMAELFLNRSIKSKQVRLPH